jgi:hypothetical protein
MAYICKVKENKTYNKLYSWFGSYDVITREDLSKFFHELEPNLKKSTFSWRIFDLKKHNIISDLKTGVYTLNLKEQFAPDLSEEIRSIYNLIVQQYDPNFSIIWDTIWLNDLTELQATSSQIILEIEKGLMDSVFYALKDEGYSELYIKPDESTTARYISEAKHPIIIKPFVSRSPVQLIENVKVPALEKVLVDLYCDEQVYFAYQGHQMEIIYRNAAARYTLNFSKLLNYAKRRKREEGVKTLLKEVLQNELKEIIE